MARVLVVDDAPNSRRATATMLRRSGHEVHEAEGGEAALVWLRCEPCDLVVTDILMPNGDGIELIRGLAATRPHVPVIAVSGGGRLNAGPYLSMAGNLGASAVLRKPFEPEELLRRVADVLSCPPRPHTA